MQVCIIANFKQPNKKDVSLKNQGGTLKHRLILLFVFSSMNQEIDCDE